MWRRCVENSTSTLIIPQKHHHRPLPHSRSPHDPGKHAAPANLCARRSPESAQDGPGAFPIPQAHRHGDMPWSLGPHGISAMHQVFGLPENTFTRSSSSVSSSTTKRRFYTISDISLRSGIENQSETPYHRDMSQIEELLKVCVPRGFKASTKQMGAFLDAGRTHHPFEINHSLFCDG